MAESIPFYENGLPWDNKSIEISLGGVNDSFGFIRLAVKDDRFLAIYITDPGSDWFCEDIDLNAAERMRDFLIYALKNHKGE